MSFGTLILYVLCGLILLAVVVVFIFLVIPMWFVEAGKKHSEAKREAEREQRRVEERAREREYAEDLQNQQKKLEETKIKWKSHPLYSDVLSCVDEVISRNLHDPHLFPPAPELPWEFECCHDGVYSKYNRLLMSYASKGHETLLGDMSVSLTMAVGEALEKKYKESSLITIQTSLSKIAGGYSSKIRCYKKEPEQPPLKKVVLG